MTFHLLTMTMFAPSITICEKFAIEVCMTLTLTFERLSGKYNYFNGKALCDFLTVEMYMTLTLTFGMGLDQMKMCQSKGQLQLSVLVIAMLVPLCNRLWDNQIWESQCTRFQSLVLQIKVKHVEDLNENWRRTYLVTVILCANIYASMSSRFSRYIIVHFVTDERTDERRYRRTAC